MVYKKWTESYLRELVSQSTSICEIIRKSGNKPSGGMHRHITGLIRRYNIDISHYTSSTWTKGKTSKEDPRIYSKPDDQMFVEYGSVNRQMIRRRFIRTDVPYICSECLCLPVWNNKPLTLHMDHINGISTDHRLTNLRWLCPNCHSQTITYSNKSAPANDVQTCTPPQSRQVPSHIKKIRSTKIVWPSVEGLYDDVLVNGYSQVAMRLGVSPNGVKKHLKKAGYVVPQYHTQRQR